MRVVAKGPNPPSPDVIDKSQKIVDEMDLEKIFIQAWTEFLWRGEWPKWWREGKLPEGWTK